MGARENRLGYAGELYVAAQLAHRGWDAALLTGGAQRHDLLASKPGVPAIKVQCKTTSSLAVPVGQEIENPPTDAAEREWVILVSLAEGPDARPRFHIVPRRIIATFVYVGTRHNTPIDAPVVGARRSLKPRDFEHFAERWELLERDPVEVPWLLDRSGAFWRWVDERPLPNGLDFPVKPAPELFSLRP